MSIAWSTVEEEIIDLINSNLFNSGGRYYKYFVPWANNLINEIAQEIDIREHLVSDSTGIAFLTTDKSKAVPTNFFKFSHRFTRVRISGTEDDSYIPIIGIDELFGYDPDRDETTTGLPDAVSIESKLIYPYPLFTGTLLTDNYFRKPTQLTVHGSNIDLPFDEVLREMLVNGFCKKAWMWLQDFDMARYCAGEYMRLLDLYRIHLDRSNSAIVNEAKYY